MKHVSIRKAVICISFALGILLSGTILQPATPSLVKVESRNMRVEFNSSMHSRVIARFDGKETVLGQFGPSETITVDGKELTDFALKDSLQQSVRDDLGSGRQFTLAGTSGSVQKTVLITVYDEFPQIAFSKVQYANKGSSELRITGWTNNRYSIAAAQVASDPPFWSYQSGSYEKRPDWVLPLKANFKQENYLGMNATDYGGGTPVVDVWRRDVGIAVGHVEMVPKLVSLPVAMPDPGQATLGISFRTDQVLKAGATLETFRSFVSVHQGDHFQTLKAYSRIMQRRGVKFQPAPESAFEPIWCAWGYGRTFTPSQVDGALPVVKKLGFSWVGVDDGWQSSDGDWLLVKTKFPSGDADMKALVDRIHAQGFRAQIWWAPLAAKPDSELVKSHPEQLLLNADGSKQKISYWNDWYLCPADAAVLEHHRRLVVKMIKEWGYDGLKLDGQHMNGVPACYNPAHKHAQPEDSVEGLPRFFQMIYETAKSIKPDALVEWCPCGTAFNFYTLPHLNMTVASDPHNSWQVRTKGKTLKALHGDSTAYFGDHVELSDERQDFASTVGIGGVPGTQFTWPAGSAQRNRLDLTPEKELIWQKWINLYKEKMPSRGQYLGELYDIGFDRPEAHAIRKSANMYYAFYAPDWRGKIELRGLDGKSYVITDYENNKELGTVRGPIGTLDVQFQKHLLLEAKPQ
jgi:alpha-galactosidase